MMEELYKASEDRYSKGKMNYRRAGKSGVLLPEISLGFWQNFGHQSHFKDAKEMVHYAFDNGIVHFDLANNYGPPYGSAEESFGKIMMDSLAPYRHEIFVATKAGHDMWQGPYGDWGSRKYLMTSLEHSLKRMNLEYVDVFYTHRYDPNTPLDETLQTLVDIVRQGKALYVGISKYPYEAAKYAFEYLKVRDVPCLAYQGRYNLLTRGLEEEGIMDLCEREGVAFLPFSPLAQGLLTDKYVKGEIPSESRVAENSNLKDTMLDKNIEKIKALYKIAETRKQSLSDMAMHWLLKDKNTASIVMGVRNKEQLKKNIETARNYKPFSKEELSEIDKICKA